MGIFIHPLAANNYNDQAKELVGYVKECPPKNPMPEAFPSDLHVAVSLVTEDIIGDVEEAQLDHLGNTISRYFRIDDKRFGIEGEAYKKLSNIAERIQLIPGIRDKLSFSYIEKCIFKWIVNIYKFTDYSDTLTEYLINQADKDIVKITSWIPVANLEVEEPFLISKSEIRPLSKLQIDNWAGPLSLLDGENAHNANLLFEYIRKEYQGLACIVTNIEAEPEHASTITIEEAKQITSILAIFSKATLIPEVKCTSRIKGSENILQATNIMVFSEAHFQMNSIILDTSANLRWRLRSKDIAEIKATAIDTISCLLTSSSPSNFNKSILNFVFLYSKSAFTSDPVEKIVYMLSSLESILLKNENEPIQQNLSERVAFFISKNREERKSIIKTIKSVYSIRSRYLHHGHSSSELAVISEFMMHVWVFFHNLLLNANRFSSKDEFISAIEDRKLA
jgi:hypothetical protein